jgi:hypothetical protein
MYAQLPNNGNLEATGKARAAFTGILLRAGVETISKHAILLQTSFDKLSITVGKI